MDTEPRETVRLSIVHLRQVGEAPSDQRWEASTAAFGAGAGTGATAHEALADLAGKEGFNAALEQWAEYVGRQQAADEQAHAQIAADKRARARRKAAERAAPNVVRLHSRR